MEIDAADINNELVVFEYVEEIYKFYKETEVNGLLLGGVLSDAFEDVDVVGGHNGLLLGGGPCCCCEGYMTPLRTSLSRQGVKKFMRCVDDKDDDLEPLDLFTTLSCSWEDDQYAGK